MELAETIPQQEAMKTLHLARKTPPQPGDVRHGKSRVTNGSKLLPLADGRSVTARRFRDIYEEVCGDLGGIEHLSEAVTLLDVSAFEAMDKSPFLLGPSFPGPSWDRHRAIAKAADGDALTENETALFQEVARRDPPPHRVRELVMIAGRGSGKSALPRLLGHFSRDYFRSAGSKLRPGETVVVTCLACDRAQAGIVFGYIRAISKTIPSLRALVINWGSDSHQLCNSVVIEVLTNNFRAVRGQSLLCVIFDEVALWRHGEFRIA